MWLPYWVQTAKGAAVMNLTAAIRVGTPRRLVRHVTFRKNASFDLGEFGIPVGPSFSNTNNVLVPFE